MSKDYISNFYINVFCNVKIGK